MGSRRMRIVIAVCAPAMNIHDPHRDDAAGAGRVYRRAGTRSSIVKGARARMLTIRPLRPPQPREESIEPRRAVFFIIVPLWPSSSSGGSTQAALRLPGQPGDGDAHRAFFLFFFLTSFIIIITSAIIIISAAAAAALYRDKPLFSSFCVVVVGRLQQFIAYIYSLRCAVIMRAGKYANEAQCSGPTTSSGVKSQREPP